MEPWLNSVRPENFIQDVILESKPVLLVCLTRDDSYTGVMTAVRNIAMRFEKILKVGVLAQDSVDIFKKRLNITGTPTFLLMLEGKEAGRILGMCSEEMLADSILKKIADYQSVRKTQEVEK